MSNCEFELVNGVWICRVCGYQYISAVPTPDKPPLARCRILPSAPRRLAHYARAVTDYVVSGCQTRTDEEVADLLAICHSCDRFNPKRQSCSLCGCRCTAGTSGFLNKLRMKTESCPRGKWN